MVDLDDDGEDVKMADRKKISKKTLAKSIPSLVLWSFDLFLKNICKPWVPDFYASNRRRKYMTQKKNKKDAILTYTAFFNTEPQLGSLVVGIASGLEEARANEEMQ